MGSADQFRTYQTVSNYESALRRHAQAVLWTRAILCPCIDQDTGQPSLENDVCPQCQGRGRIYKTPGPQEIFDEVVKHDEDGVLFPRHTPIIPNSFTVRVPARDDTGNTRSIPATLADDVLQIEFGDNVPDVPLFDIVYLDYQFDPAVRVIGDVYSDSLFQESNIFSGHSELKLDVGVTQIRGKTFHGRLISVEGVRLVDADSDDRTVLATISSAEVRYNYDSISISTATLTSTLQSLQGNSVEVEVDYTYTKVFQFLISGISEKQRYTSPFITKEADAQLTAPHWTKFSPNDIFTLLSAQQIGEEIIDPSISGDGEADQIRSYFDIVRILEVHDADGNSYVGHTTTPPVSVLGRNSLWWPDGKPNSKYTVQFLYNPSYVAIESFPSLRNAEGKSFVNKINLRKWSQTSSGHRTH